MIPRKIFVTIHKYFFAWCGAGDFWQSKWLRVLTISNIFNWKELPYAGNVTWCETGFQKIMQTDIQSFPHGCPDTQTGGIAVENLDFSTFSTAFSTGVFHSRKNKGYSFWVYINRIDNIRQISHFFAPRNNYHRRFLCAKFGAWQVFLHRNARRVEKWGKLVQCRHFLKCSTGYKKFLKKGLILWSKDAIM